MPLALAFAAGSLSVVNPCGFALLPAFLAFYVGGGEGGRVQLSRARVGLLVSAGFLAVIVAVGAPILLGAHQITGAIPWAGLVIGVVLTVVGVAALGGRHVGVTIGRNLSVRRERTGRAMFMFGAAYAVASLGCTLPVLLALIALSLSRTGVAGAAGVLASYALGMLVVVTALAFGAGGLRDGLAGRMKRLVPLASRLGGGLLAAAGGYLSYYWAQVAFSSAVSLGDDPVVSLVQRWTGSVERLAGTTFMRATLVVAVVVVVAATARELRRGRGPAPP